MLKVKIALSVITVAFAVSGLSGLMPFYISNSLMLTFLAALMLLRSVEYKNSGDKSGFIFTVISALFLCVVVIYNVWMG